MVTYATKLEKWQHRIMTMLRKRLDNEVFMSGHRTPTWAIAEEFKVTHLLNIQEFIIDIGKRSCSCNFWNWLLFHVDMLSLR